MFFPQNKNQTFTVIRLNYFSLYRFTNIIKWFCNPQTTSILQNETFYIVINKYYIMSLRTITKCIIGFTIILTNILFYAEFGTLSTRVIKKKETKLKYSVWILFMKTYFLSVHDKIIIYKFVIHNYFLKQFLFY